MSITANSLSRETSAAVTELLNAEVKIRALESQRDKLAEALREACALLEENHTSRQLCPDEDHEFIAKAMGLLNSCGCMKGDDNG